MATIAAAGAFKRVWTDPDGDYSRGEFVQRLSHYQHLWARYKNTVFEDQLFWAGYRRTYGMYKYTRSIYNPVTRLVDFYAGIVYPGVLSTDGKRLPDGVPLAIPLAEDIDPALRMAIGQLWQWSNWQIGKSLLVRYGAALGDVGIEIVDEVDRGKITFDIIRPELVKNLELDSTSNVKAYTLEWQAKDSTGDYIYSKYVDGDVIAEYRDGELWKYDENIDAERANPYGFAPLVWCKHRDEGGDHGEPAVRNLTRIDELNGLASHAYDRAHAILNSPILFSGENVQSLTDEVTNVKLSDTTRTDRPNAGRESVRILKSGPGGTATTIDLPEGEVLNHIDRLMAGVESDHPELSMYEQLRAQSQVTGPGAEKLVGDTAIYVIDARANYDTQSIKAHQMAVAIGGWRANTGAWGRNLSSQQRVFAPFGLDSYDRGQLDFEIMPRPLVPQSRMEMLALQQMEMSIELQRSMSSGDGLTQASQAQVERSVIREAIDAEV